MQFILNNIFPSSAMKKIPGMEKNDNSLSECGIQHQFSCYDNPRQMLTQMICLIDQVGEQSALKKNHLGKFIMPSLK